MEEKKKSVLQIVLTTTVIVLFIAVAVLVVFIHDRTEASAAGRSDMTPQSSDGTAYIMEKEALPVAPIEEVIREEDKERSEEISGGEDAEADVLPADPDSIFEKFRNSNTILVGESRTSGFSAYGFLDDNHVLGGIGWSIQEIPALYDQIAALQPANIVFSFGINELGRYPDTPVYYYAPEIYTEDLGNFIETIRGMLPNTKFYINCIVPCTEAVYQEYPGYGVIPEWNRFIEKFCREKGYGFIDISDLCAEYAWMYREDGTHLISDFYPYWGARILEVINNNEK